MASKAYRNILLFCLFSICMWFFGNLYEAIVLAPNLLVDSAEKVYSWRALFTITNPAFFYIPTSPIAIIPAIILFFKTDKEQPTLKKHLRYACIFLLLATALGIYIITQINLKFFFAHGDITQADAYKLALCWNILNAIRIVLLAFAIRGLFRSYILTQIDSKQNLSR